MNDNLLSIEKNFASEYRMNVPKFKMSETNITYLNLLSKRLNRSRSRTFEKIFLEAIFLHLPENHIFWLGDKPRKRAKWKRKQKKYRKSPSFCISPSTLSILERTKENREVSFTLLVDEIFYVYRKRYPLMF